MEDLLFNIYERSEKGSKVRQKGEIPCVIYGNDLSKSVSGKITRKDLTRLLGCPKSSVLSLKFGDNTKNCVVKELQQDPFGKIIHVDFQSIKKGEMIKFKIPIIFLGKGALESKGLVLESFISEVELTGEPNNIPRNVEVDISKMDKSSEIFARDLSIPENVILELSEDMTIAKIDISSNNEEPVE